MAFSLSPSLNAGRFPRPRVRAPRVRTLQQIRFRVRDRPSSVEPPMTQMVTFPNAFHDLGRSIPIPKGLLSRVSDVDNTDDRSEISALP